jgi:hypothetical protein
MGPIDSPETSVNDCQLTLHKIQKSEDLRQKGICENYETLILLFFGYCTTSTKGSEMIQSLTWND